MPKQKKATERPLLSVKPGPHPGSTDITVDVLHLPPAEPFFYANALQIRATKDYWSPVFIQLAPGSDRPDSAVGLEFSRVTFKHMQDALTPDFRTTVADVIKDVEHPVLVEESGCSGPVYPVHFVKIQLAVGFAAFDFYSVRGVGPPDLKPQLVPMVRIETPARLLRLFLEGVDRWTL